jgi:hypothetical protein
MFGDESARHRVDPPVLLSRPRLSALQIVLTLQTARFLVRLAQAAASGKAAANSGMGAYLFEDVCVGGPAHRLCFLERAGGGGEGRVGTELESAKG